MSRKTMEFRRFSVGPNGRLFKRGRIQGSEGLEITLPCGTKYTIWPSELDPSLCIELDEDQGNAVIRPHSRIIAIGACGE